MAGVPQHDARQGSAHAGPRGGGRTLPMRIMPRGAKNTPQVPVGGACAVSGSAGAPVLAPGGGVVVKPRVSVPANPGAPGVSVPANPGAPGVSVPANPGAPGVSVPANPGAPGVSVPANPGAAEGSALIDSSPPAAGPTCAPLIFPKLFSRSAV